jgi:carbonic anhydrase
MQRLRAVTSVKDIPEPYSNTPVSKLFEYHNMGHPFKNYERAELLVGMCMDNRKYLHIPDNFAYIIRSGGANLRYSEFKVSYAIAVGKVAHIVLIGHNHCGMVNLMSRRNDFIEGLISVAGWDKERAEEHFMNYAPMFEVGNEIDFTLSETKRLRMRYPRIMIAPLYYKLEENRLYYIEE